MSSELPSLTAFQGGGTFDQLHQFFALFGVIRAGVVDEGGESGGAGGCQRPPRPPDVERGGVAVADVLLTGRGLGDVGQGEVVFDEAAGWGHIILSTQGTVISSLIIRRFNLI